MKGSCPTCLASAPHRCCSPAPLAASAAPQPHPQLQPPRPAGLAPPGLYDVAWTPGEKSGLKASVARAALYKLIVVGEWFLGVGGFVWSFYTMIDHSENGDYDGGWKL